MLEAVDFIRDWGPWGWVWALGLVTFVAGLVLVPLVQAGEAPLALLFAFLPGAVLMWGSAHGAGAALAKNHM